MSELSPHYDPGLAAERARILEEHTQFFRNLDETNMLLLAGRMPLKDLPPGLSPIGTTFTLLLDGDALPGRVLEWWSERNGMYAAVCWVPGDPACKANNPLPTGHIRVALCGRSESVRVN